MTSKTDLREMCRTVAESAENWGDCSDMREALAVFRELGRKCHDLLHADRAERTSIHRYVLYDFDADELASTNAYGTREEAADDAQMLDNVVVLRVEIGRSNAGGA